MKTPVVACALGLLAAFPALSHSVPASPLLASPDDGIWITVGADAFEVLEERPEFLFEQRALKAVEQRDDVVISRVRAGDLLEISELMHEEFQRCGGFLAHGSLEEAQEALLGATRDAFGAPINYVIDQPEWVSRLHDQLVPNNILNTIDHLSTAFNNRYYAHPSGVNAAQWIHDLWASHAAGRPDVTVELYNHSWAQSSVVATITGSTRPDEVVVLGGHLDSIASGTGNPDFLAPGADDNASGIAVLSEVFRAAMAEGMVPNRTVKFMGYAAEEIGLLGSQDIAAEHQSDGINVVAVLQLDMTNFNGSVEDVAFLTDFTNPQLRTFAGQIMDVYLPDLLWTTTACGYGCSDHASWHNRGFPALMPSEAKFGQHNQALHTTQDTLATMGDNVVHATKFARLASAYLAEIALVEQGELFLDGFESGNLSGWSTSVP